MKLIISQDGHQIFTCGGCQVYNLSTADVPGRKKGSLFSVGVGGLSFGLFRTKERAAEVLKEIAVFLGSRDTLYTVPADDGAPPGEPEETGTEPAE